MSHNCNCSNCRKHKEFDAEQAYKHLYKKYIQLSEVVVEYMSEAGLKRSERTRNANDMAARLATIVGGTETSEFPECCLVGNNSGWFCTGVLVNPQIVLTAAHCQEPAPNNINLVALNCENKDDLTNAEIIKAKRVQPHPDYFGTGKNDITVIILQTKAKTAPIPPAISSEINLAIETTLVGFGRTDSFASASFGIKREVKVPITYIRRSPQDNLDQAEIEYNFESDLEFVAGKNGFDSCNGDSGGPAYIFVNGTRKVAGLTSRGFPHQLCGEGGIYTRLDVQREFIKHIAEINSVQL